jgi:hypothetical protein
MINQRGVFAMKKILFGFLFLLLTPLSVLAADTCTTAALSAEDAAAGAYDVLVTCAADASTSLEVPLTSTDMAKFNRKFVYLVTSYDNDVTAVGASGAELEIRDSLGRVIMDNSNHGQNFIVNGGPPTTGYTEGPNGDHYWLTFDDYPWTIFVENITKAGTVHLLFSLVSAK